MRTSSYIYRRISKHPTKLLYVIHNCRHCNHNDEINVPSVVQSHYGSQLGRFVHRCTKCGTTGVIIKWQLKSRWLTLNHYVHKSNDPVDVRKSFDSYVETVQTLLGIGDDSDSKFDYLVDDYEQSPTIRFAAGGRSSGKTIRGLYD
jgi:hypothetical protein